MKYVGIRELKAQLARYLRAVEAGDTLTVTSRKRPIARVVPIKKREEIEETLEALAEQGLLRRSRRKPSPVARPPSALSKSGPPSLGKNGPLGRSVLKVK